MPRLIAAACFVMALAPAQARAQFVQWFDEGAVETKPNERRAEVTIGGAVGVLTGAASGFPNEIAKIDDERFEAETGFGAGGFGSVWLGGAFTDWLTFAVGFSGGSLGGSQGDAAVSTILFRVETYPLVGLGGALGDLGLFGNFGLGTLTIEESGREDGEGGSLSYVGIGALYEAWRPGAFALGPSVEYVHLWSVTGTLQAAHIALRIAYYGGPDKPTAAPVNRHHAARR